MNTKFFVLVIVLCSFSGVFIFLGLRTSSEDHRLDFDRDHQTLDLEQKQNTEAETDSSPILSVIEKPEEKMSETQEQRATEAREITMRAYKFAFEPSTIEVKKGETVRLTVENLDVEHGIILQTLDPHDSEANTLIDLRLEEGETKTVEFVADRVGQYRFFCSVYCGAGHSTMDGTLVVVE